MRKKVRVPEDVKKDNNKYKILFFLAVTLFILTVIVLSAFNIGTSQ